jgi:hypothetical protein
MMTIAKQANYGLSPQLVQKLQQDGIQMENACSYTKIYCAKSTTQKILFWDIPEISGMREARKNIHYFDQCAEFVPNLCQRNYSQ